MKITSFKPLNSTKVCRQENRANIPVFLMSEPRWGAADPYRKKWDFMKRAMETAGAQVVLVDTGTHAFARDRCIPLQGRVFTSVRGKELVDLFPLLNQMEDRGHKKFALWLDDPYSSAYDGGNCVPDLAQANVFFGGMKTVNARLRDYEMASPDRNEPVAYDMEILEEFAADVTARSSAIPYVIDATHIHIDSVLGFLPNGKVLIKKDETGEASARKHGIDVVRHHRILEGVLPEGEGMLQCLYGAKNVISFAFADKAADIVLGADVIEADPARARALSMMTNFETVRGTVVGNALPAPVTGMLRHDGFRTLFPEDIGAASFMIDPADGYPGGIRCVTLPADMPEIK